MKCCQLMRSLCHLLRYCLYYRSGVYISEYILLLPVPSRIICKHLLIMERLNGNVPCSSVPEVPESSETSHNVSYADVVSQGKIITENSSNTVSNNNMERFDPNDNVSLEESVSIYETASAKTVCCSDSVEISDPNQLNSFCVDQNNYSSLEYDQLKESSICETQNSSEILPEVSEETLSSPSQLSATNNVIKETESGSELSSAGDYSGNGEDSDSEESIDFRDIYPAAVKWQFRTQDPKLPETVTVLTAKNGGRVYLVGTAHFSIESQEDVAKTIRATQPDIVVVELCKSRVNILSLDEATILEESKNMNFQKIRAAIEQNGFMQGVLYLLLLNMSAHLTKQLGMAPGGEFRKAFLEAKKVPGCLVHLGDRPIHITLQRALATLSWWQKLRIGWYMLTSKEPISKQEVERCKQRDLLEETLAEMTGEFPELSQVFVKERDIYLAYSLQMAALPMPSQVSPQGIVPTIVVGVVGIGHVPGIVENWDKVTENDIPHILSIPEASISSKVLRKAFKTSLIGLLVYGCYRCLPESVIKRPLSVITSWFGC